MKFSFIGLAITLVLAATTHAQTFEPKLCDSLYCTDKMKEVLYQFNSSEHIPTKDLSAFSGTCYHIRPGLDPDDTHHGVMLLRKAQPEKTFTGLFSFYAKKNPYADMNLSELDQMFESRNSKKHLTTGKEHFEFLDIASENANIYYWWKTTANQAWLVSLHNYKNSNSDVRVFCHLQKRHN